MMAAVLKNASQLQHACAPHVSVCSPAKINLTLEVLGHRSDGYHDLRSVVVGVDLHDHLSFHATEDRAITLTCDSPGLPTDDRNLVVQAASALASTSDPHAGVSIALSKRIPVAAGLGGGSGNAAAALLALNRLWELGLDQRALSRIGASLGSDVPLFFALPSARITGRGDAVEEVQLAWHGWVLLVFAGCGVSTRDVYAAWSASDRPHAVDGPADAVMGAQTAVEVARLCRNDLEPAVFRVAPRVKELHDAVSEHAGREGRVSGAGQTVFVPFDDREEAESVQAKLRSRGIGTGSCLVSTQAGPMTIG